MTKQSLLSHLSNGLYIELEVVEKTTTHEKIRTNCLYPDGDFIDIFVETRDGKIIASDFGETIRWLKDRIISKNLDLDENIVKDICQTHNVEFINSQLQTECGNCNKLADHIMQVALASVRLSTFCYFLPKNQADEDIRTGNVKHFNNAEDLIRELHNA